MRDLEEGRLYRKGENLEAITANILREIRKDTVTTK